MTDDTQNFTDGADAAKPDPTATPTKAKVPTPQERADCTRWLRCIESARDFDKVARKRYALDRRYARADHGKFRVDVPTAQSYIDVLRSFLYAQDPNVDVQPSGFSQPPPQKEIEAMVLAQQQNAPPTAPVQGGQPGGLASIIHALSSAHGSGAPGAVPGLPMPQGAPPPPTFGDQPPPGAGAGSPPPNSNAPPTQTGTDPNSLLMQQVQAILKPYQQLRDDSKQLADTLELVVAALWKKAKLKRQALPLVNSSLTVAAGWIKAVWLERTGKDPLIQQKIDDIMDNLASMAETKREIESGESNDVDALKAQLEQQKEGLEAQVEMVVARGFAIDFIAAEDMQVAPECRDMYSYLDSPWLAQRAFISVKQAKADYPDIEANIKSATMYFREKTVDATIDRDVGIAAGSEVTAEEADSYRKGSSDNQAAGFSANASASASEEDSFICVWEAWNRDSSMVLTFIEGLDVYAKAPFPPDPGTSRFYPYFLYEIGHIDGERHPRSLITRSERLFDEYNRTRSNFSEHRARSIPKTAFNAGQLDKENASKLERGGIQEMVGVHTLDPSINLQNVLVPISYAQVDEKLYDTSPIRSELEMIWGVQEALSAQIHVAKTATEAQIAHEGSQSRTGYMRAGLDEMMNDLAQYTAEVALQKMSVEDVKAICGPWCLWPTGMGIEDMNSLVDVNIHAGSTGKPDTASEQQAWAAILPDLKSAIQEVGQLRGSTKEEVADCIEALIEETIRRTGDRRTDATAFLPDPPRTPVPPPPPPAPPPIELSVMAGPQIAGLTAILADVKGGVITPASAISLIQIVAPAVPLHMVQQAVQGSTPQLGDAPVALDTKNVSPIPPTPLPDIHIHAPGADPAANHAPGMMPPNAGTVAPPLPHMSPEPMNPRMHP
jgi:hypothetical protein